MCKGGKCSRSADKAQAITNKRRRANDNKQCTHAIEVGARFF